ncbi:MAG: undecaprenyldiphospho-muramoylpentapeptide beta-N-acetylglucosaminyltransferase [Planctomycetota bacterium]|nr:MAG: undecaprenyldiphospho-muramoylpentapeptide beta-N-acetylglucosaminyltransferase [Planctomycetota bacterium]
MIVIAAGGTGGHLYPAIALAQELKKIDPNSRVLLTGSLTPIDEEIYNSSGIPFVILPFSRPKISLLGLPKTLLMIFHSTIKALSLFKKEKIKVAVVCGGFACIPIALASRLKKIPLILLEQNAIPGRTNRFLASKAHTIYIEFDESKKYFSNNNVIRAGNPIRENLKNITNDLNNNTLVFMGGSLGASKINQIASDIIPTLATLYPTYNIIHLTGKNDFIKIKDLYTNYTNIEVFEFLFDMKTVYTKATLIIGRSGATSIAELACIGIPAIFIPYPYAKDDHQKLNAMALVKVGAGIMIEEDELNSEVLLSNIKYLLDNKENLTNMRNSLLNWSTPDAGKVIAEKILNITTQ